MTNITHESISNDSILEQQDQALVKAFYQLDQSRKINILASILIIILGLIGNGSIVAILSKKKCLINPFKVYIFYLAIVDGLFLVVHLFEDTIRNYNDIYNTNHEAYINEFQNIKKTRSNFHSFILFINLTDRYDLMCRLVNYFRYVLRFTSAYIIVVFTVQRLYTLYFPANNSFKTKKSARIIVATIISLSILMNLWVIFLFELQKDDTKDTKQFCDIRLSWKTEYFQISSFFICLVILIPIMVIISSDLVMFFFLLKANQSKKSNRIRKNSNFKTNERHFSTQNMNLSKINTSHYKRKHLDLLKTSITRLDPISSNRLSFKMKVNLKTNMGKKSYQNKNKFSIKLNSKFFKQNQFCETIDKNSRKLSIMTILISLSFAMLNLPYLIVWAFFYKELTFNKQLDLPTKYKFFSTVQIAEIFFLLYYSLNFYFYCLFSSILSDRN